MPGWDIHNSGNTAGGGNCALIGFLKNARKVMLALVFVTGISALLSQLLLPNRDFPPLVLATSFVFVGLLFWVHMLLGVMVGEITMRGAVAKCGDPDFVTLGIMYSFVGFLFAAMGIFMIVKEVLS